MPHPRPNVTLGVSCLIYLSKPSPGADVAGASPVPVQMWQRRAPAAPPARSASLCAYLHEIRACKRTSLSGPALAHNRWRAVPSARLCAQPAGGPSCGWGLPCAEGQPGGSGGAADFTLENGATHVLPKSHLWSDHALTNREKTLLGLQEERMLQVTAARVRRFRCRCACMAPASRPCRAG